MRKTFAQLVPDDKIYVAIKNAIKYSAENIREVHHNEIKYGYGMTVPRHKTDVADVVRQDRYSYSESHYRIFANEVDAIRYCKAQMMKHLFFLIKGAKNGIEAVKNFRQENYELLNHSWTEEQIQKMERELRF